MLAPLNRFAMFFPERNENCTDCGTCHKVCPMKTKSGDTDLGVYDSAPEECISCLECRDKCPADSIKLWG
ncbi:MAG: 4Fe-4S dicluster domain-containing protein, partial [Desulfomonilaceae bacterium]